jgi:hypothetical protein
VEVLIKKPDEVNQKDTPYLLKDLLQGETAVALRPQFQALQRPEIQKGIRLVIENEKLSPKIKQELLLNMWRVNYREKPPSMKEFLTNEWIGPMADSLHPHIREILENFWGLQNKYRHLVLGSAIGTGKSTAAVLHNLYVSVHLYLMRDPKRFFEQAPSSSIIQAFISFSMDKATQLLMQPFIQILSTSPKFRRVKQEEHLRTQQAKHPDVICWTTASQMGSLQFPGDIHYIVASNPYQLLGLNMIQSTMSEISFFIERGYSPEYIWRIYQDSKSRIFSRFGNKQFCGTVLDSSPNDLDASPIDKYIFTGEALKDKENYVSIGSQWEMYEKDPERKRIKALYPIYAITKETFPVFRGNSSLPPEMVYPDSLHTFDESEIYHVPIDLKREFEQDTERNVKNVCGWPANTSGKLINSQARIEEIFTPQLKNIYKYIKVASTDPAKHLIWNQIKNRFFIQTGPDRWEFYRAPRARRWLHFDQAETGDFAGIAMSHREYDIKRNEFIIVHDFILAITGGQTARINLDAFRQFPEDLRNLGKIDLQSVTFDRFQSSTTVQYLKEQGFNARQFSVDTSVDPYISYAALINIGNVKAGRNIFLKNNIKSLHEVRTVSGKRKINHMIGKIIRDDGGHWALSQMGMYAKDCSDCCAATAYLLVHKDEGTPQYIYDRDLDKPFEDEPISITGATLGEQLSSIAYPNGKEPVDFQSTQEYKELLKKRVNEQLDQLGLSVRHDKKGLLRYEPKTE